MTTLFRFALLAIAIAVCAPPRLPSCWDCLGFSSDDEECDIGGAMTDDDGADDYGPATLGVRSAAETPVATLGGSDRESSASMSAAGGLSASAGVMGPVFRPPRT